MQRAELVITTGGLGPTNDDITKKSICKYFKRPLIFYENILKKIQERFSKRGIKMPPINQNQALLPQGAEFIDNELGSAVGIALEENNKLFVATPGVPVEMKPMIDGWITEAIRKRPGAKLTIHRKIRTVGIMESAIFEKIDDLVEPQNKLKAEKVSVAFLPSWRGVDIRLTTQSRNEHEGKQRIKTLEEKIVERIDKYVFGYDNDELAYVVGELLKSKRLSLAVAESCTGGMLGSMITDIPGSSEYFLGGVISYSNELKMKMLSVPQIILEKYGAVSSECVSHMAEGVMRQTGADIGIAITGVAGPSGGSPEKPVGKVFIGLAAADYTDTQELQFGCDRDCNRERAATFALDMIRRYLKEKS
jgi:nicotinamide-nucleotide amidase